MTEPNHGNPAPQDAQISKAVVMALSAMSAALTVATVVIGALAFVVWIRSGLGGQPADFPGRYLFAVLPLLFAAGTLKMYAVGIERGLS
jgi:hypothetical protein